jgi:hypothetical protein
MGSKHIVQAPAQRPDLTLEFFDWQAGHHGHAPSRIEGLSSLHQCEAILAAIAAGMSQPSHGRARVLDGDLFFEHYITDDHHSQVTAGHRPKILLVSASERVSFTDDEVDDIKEGVDQYGDFVADWRGGPLPYDALALCRLTLAEVESLLPKAASAHVPPVIVIDGDNLLRKALREGLEWREQLEAA